MSKNSTESEKRAFTKELMRRASEGMGNKHNAEFKAKSEALKKKKIAKRVSEIGRNIAEKTKKYGSESREAHPYSKF